MSNATHSDRILEHDSANRGPISTQLLCSQHRTELVRDGHAAAVTQVDSQARKAADFGGGFGRMDAG